MFTEILCLAVALSTAQATGKFIVLHSPDSIQFKGNEQLPQSLLTEVFTASLGYTAKQRGTWDGMTMSDPFDLPEAVVNVAIGGVDSIEVPAGKHFPLVVDEDEETSWQALSGRLEERDNADTLIRINLGDGVDTLGQSTLGELKLKAIDELHLKYLSLNNDADKKFLEQIQLLDAISEKVLSTTTADNKPDVYWFVLSALPAVLEYHGKDSLVAKESFNLLNKALNRMSNAFMKVYDEKVLIAVFTNDAAHVRHTRDTMAENLNRADNITPNGNNETLESTTEANIIQDTTETYEKQQIVLKSENLNRAKAYDSTYPVMFNIFLWFGVAFVFSLIAVCITIADMDPGRDSIIYRMTSNRMKKDN